jgi:hypothetical protein
MYGIPFSPRKGKKKTEKSINEVNKELNTKVARTSYCLKIKVDKNK